MARRAFDPKEDDAVVAPSAVPVAGPPPRPRAPRRPEPAALPLRMPVIGMEAEFTPVVDGVDVDPLAYWSHPSDFVEAPMLPRTGKSSQLPTGGAVYFDTGAVEVVTPVIELAPSCTARMVRNLWEQIGFVRAELTKWEARSGHTVTLRAFSSHYNVAFELSRRERAHGRTIDKLALLLAYVLPVPVALVATNRRSTGVGVRPRGNRIEVTVDFTPDPSRMLAAAALIVGIVRDVMSWSSYELGELASRGIPTVAGIVPGKHTSRRGWLTKDHQYQVSPYTCDPNAPLFPVADGRVLSLREMARETAWRFRRSIRRTSDAFSFRLLFAILEGRVPSLLELSDRPGAYEDVGRACRWGAVIEELRCWRPPSGIRWRPPTPFPDRGLARSDYESVFLRMVAGGSLRIGGRLFKPVAMKGWYHAVLRGEADGEERILSLDRLLQLIG